MEKQYIDSRFGITLIITVILMVFITSIIGIKFVSNDLNLDWKVLTSIVGFCVFVLLMLQNMFQSVTISLSSITVRNIFAKKHVLPWAEFSKLRVKPNFVGS